MEEKMRPKNTKDTRWVISTESYHPTKADALRTLRGDKPKLPSTIENVGRTRTPFGTYRRNEVRLRTFRPNLYKGLVVHTAPMTLARAKEVKQYHPDEKLVKVKGAYFYF
jgi:hypothetical protein